METAVYLYCLTRARSLPELHMKGVNNGAPVVITDFGDIAAVVAEVPLSEYCGEAAEDNLQDLAWVGPRAIRHAEIIESVRGMAPVLPSRFGTLFSSMDGLKRLVELNMSKIETFLDAVSAADEWSVKVLSSRASFAEKLFSERLASQSEIFAGMAPGLRYFKERQLRSAVEKEVGARLSAVLTEAAGELSRCSEDRRKREIVDAQEEGGLVGVANWAFLVARKAEAEFKSVIERANAGHNSGGVFFQMSGPWPAYSFTPELTMEDGE
ncbi:MAG: GvpL/GvpF family gas vesicle protein [Desulfomonilaceae bacterium]|nr:GvpL/GvpF family gas vesicle protein [Desulfomonilaceae bacterium]